jgi:rubrerythrin
MTEPEYTETTENLGMFTVAVYICGDCEREWYDDHQTPNPSYCPYCGVEQ